jgi:hypothetical protein
MKLSRLQKTILSMAKNQGHVSNSDILTAVYGFEQTVFSRGARFDRQRIGMDRYLSASAAVARSLTWLRDQDRAVYDEIEQRFGISEWTPAG